MRVCDGQVQHERPAAGLVRTQKCDRPLHAVPVGAVFAHRSVEETEVTRIVRREDVTITIGAAGRQVQVRH